MNTYAGEPVLLPFFDSTCNTEPTNTLISGCPDANVGGAGNQWYHVTKFLSFQLAAPKGAFVNGNNTAECGVTNAKSASRVRSSPSSRRERDPGPARQEDAQSGPRSRSPAHQVACRRWRRRSGSESRVGGAALSFRAPR